MKKQRLLFLFLCILFLAIPGSAVIYRAAIAPFVPWLELRAGATIAERLEKSVNEWTGFGSDMRKISMRIRNLGDTGGKVIVGSDGWLFLNLGKLQRRVSGAFIDHGRVDEWFQRAKMHFDKQTSAGKRFIFISPPDKYSIYHDNLPDHFSYDIKRKDSLDVMHQRLSDAGIPFADLREYLRNAKERWLVYDKVDTHWNNLGAMMAFNLAMDEVGYPEKKLEPDEFLAGFESSLRAGDLVETGGLEPREVESPVFKNGLYDLSGFALAEDSTDGHSNAYQMYRLARTESDLEKGKRPRVAVIGDSFTREYFRPFLARSFGSVLWIHHLSGKYDNAVIEDFDPDLLILAVVERSLR